ncbi:small RNA-binding protein 11, chloroplastic-like [Lolium rigidum]|uniref:small RNA-binding protein 11, chloroplastic-like n=1 Tax=Lolium rigidum TaxID=89674 RepID=UPI001F5D6021|nr:small RNA-binding protein 11, chloroplastic-like [Lolium rigidum]
MAMAALREASRRLVSTRNPAVAIGVTAPRPLLLTHSRGITHKLFIGGLSQFATEDSLSEAFARYGQVLEATIVTDKMTSRSKGFGFVKFASEEEANKAREDMNGKVLNGRVIYVDIAKAKQDRAADGVPIARGPPKPIGDN